MPEAGPPGLTRRRLLAGLAAPFPAAVSGPSLVARLEGDRLRISAPHLRFLNGRPLERLRDGASVVFDVQLSLWTQRTAGLRERAIERFVVSYDLWEEKFSVARPGRPPQTVSHLTATGVEAWCLDHLTLSVAGLAPERPFWIRLELRAQDSRERPGVAGEPGVSLTRLIELFSRAHQGRQSPSVLEEGPLRLADLRKAAGRG